MSDTNSDIGQLERQLAAALREIADHERWLTEMCDDYKLAYDPHNVSKRIAINELIHGLRDQVGTYRLNEQKRIGEFSNLMAELGNEQSRRLAGDAAEKKLRAALLEFVHCENKFGHTGQHPEAECVDCKRVNTANDALGHGYLRPAPQESVNTAKFSEPIWDSRNSDEPVELR